MFGLGVFVGFGGGSGCSVAAGFPVRRAHRAGSTVHFLEDDDGNLFELKQGN